MSEYKTIMQKVKEIGIINGLNFKSMTVYKAQLIHFRNDGMTAKEIASILNTKDTTVENWYSKGSQPKEAIIEKLEKMFFESDLF